MISRSLRRCQSAAVGGAAAAAEGPLVRGPSACVPACAWPQWMFGITFVVCNVSTLATLLFTSTTR
jgi:hypothetical protein